MTFQSLKENNHPQIWIQEMKIEDYLMFGATIRIGQEMHCLPYARFFFTDFVKEKKNLIFLLYFGSFLFKMHFPLHKIAL